MIVCLAGPLQGGPQRSDRELGDRGPLPVLVAVERVAAGAAGPPRHLVLPHCSHRHQGLIQGKGKRLVLVPRQVCPSFHSVRNNSCHRPNGNTL